MIVRLMTMALIGVAALVAGQAQAQDWPSKPVRIVAGFAAGGIADLGARLLAEQITRSTGQQAVVENRTGAAGTLGMDVVAKAAPDGTTFGLVLNGNLVINPFVQKSMPFDAMKDLVPVAAIGDAPQMIAMSTEVPAKTFKEFQALAKAKPEDLQLRLGRSRARCRTCRRPSSRGSPASSWCTCPIAATRRRWSICWPAASS